MAIDVREVLDLVLIFMLTAYFCHAKLSTPPPHHTIHADAPETEMHKVETRKVETPEAEIPKTEDIVAQLVEKAMRPVVEWHDSQKQADEKKTAALEASQHAIMSRQKMFEQVTEKHFSKIQDTQKALESRLGRVEENPRAATNETVGMQNKREIQNLHRKLRSEKNERQRAEKRFQSIEDRLTKVALDAELLRAKVQNERQQRIEAEDKSRGAAASMVHLATEVESLQVELDRERRRRQQAEHDLAVEQQATKQAKAFPKPANERSLNSDSDKLSRHAVATFKLYAGKPELPPLPNSTTSCIAVSGRPSLDELAELMDLIRITERKDDPVLNPKSFLTHRLPLYSQPVTSQEPIIQEETLSEDDTVPGGGPITEVQPFTAEHIGKAPEASVQQGDDAGQEVAIDPTELLLAATAVINPPITFSSSVPPPGTWLAQAAKFSGPRPNMSFAEALAAAVPQATEELDVEMAPALDRSSGMGHVHMTVPGVDEEKDMGMLSAPGEASVMEQNIEALPDVYESDVDMLPAQGDSSVAEHAFWTFPSNDGEIDVDMGLTPGDISVVSQATAAFLDNDDKGRMDVVPAHSDDNVVEEAIETLLVNDGNDGNDMLHAPSNSSIIPQGLDTSLGTHRSDDIEMASEGETDDRDLAQLWIELFGYNVDLDTEDLSASMPSTTAEEETPTAHEQLEGHTLPVTVQQPSPATPITEHALYEFVGETHVDKSSTPKSSNTTEKVSWMAHEQLEEQMTPVTVQQPPAENEQVEVFDKWGVLLVPHVPKPKQEQEQSDGHSDTPPTYPSDMQADGWGSWQPQPDPTNAGSSASGSTVNPNQDGHTPPMMIFGTRPLLKMPAGRRHKFTQEQIQKMKEQAADAPRPSPTTPPYVFPQPRW
ncbi:hypothetical protein N0V93_007883 [Gnomoniopsis smithogilvyi]|uniref:Uncharacterized protein n=1 Tax=Gnomoniopsis smithogilvyi TaxID=1191159 RepID=A0A9W8YKP0_9PEZI|nr:hypothetical protein N0V93_007883 [Gnomoniopsis smithogilvyi]